MPFYFKSPKKLIVFSFEKWKAYPLLFKLTKSIDVSSASKAKKSSPTEYTYSEQSLPVGKYSTKVELFNLLINVDIESTLNSFWLHFKLSTLS